LVQVATCSNLNELGRLRPGDIDVLISKIRRLIT
jgi:hypothetical protein